MTGTDPINSFILCFKTVYPGAFTDPRDPPRWIEIWLQNIRNVTMRGLVPEMEGYARGE